MVTINSIGVGHFCISVTQTDMYNLRKFPAQESSNYNNTGIIPHIHMIYIYICIYSKEMPSKQFAIYSTGCLNYTLPMRYSRDSASHQLRPNTQSQQYVHRSNSWQSWRAGQGTSGNTTTCLRDCLLWFSAPLMHVYLEFQISILQHILEMNTVLYTFLRTVVCIYKYTYRHIHMWPHTHTKIYLSHTFRVFTI